MTECIVESSTRAYRKHGKGGLKIFHGVARADLRWHVSFSLPLMFLILMLLKITGLFVAHPFGFI